MSRRRRKNHNYQARQAEKMRMKLEHGNWYGTRRTLIEKLGVWVRKLFRIERRRMQ